MIMFLALALSDVLFIMLISMINYFMLYEQGKSGSIYNLVTN